jgi:hypothetical protein
MERLAFNARAALKMIQYHNDILNLPVICRECCLRAIAADIAWYVSAQPVVGDQVRLVARISVSNES